MSDGLLYLLDMAGSTIAQLQAENERLREENGALMDQMAKEPTPTIPHAVVDPRPVRDANG